MRRCLFIVALTLASVASARAEVIERIVAVVGEEIILLSELEDATESLRRVIAAQAENLPPDAPKQQWIEVQLARSRGQVLDQMIHERLVLAEAERLQLQASDAEITEAISRFAQTQNLSVEELRRTIQNEGFTWEAYEEEWRRRLVETRVRQRVVAGQVQLSESDERAYYNQHYKEAGPEEVHLRILFLKAGEDAKAKVAVQAKAEKLLKRLRAGESFEELARQYSEGPNPQQGGDVGFIGRGQMLAPVEQAAFALKSGERSGIVEAAPGLFILQALEKRGGGAPPPFEEVREQIRDQLWSERAEKAFGIWLEDKIRETHIEKRL